MNPKLGGSRYLGDIRTGAGCSSSSQPPRLSYELQANHSPPIFLNQFTISEFIPPTICSVTATESPLDNMSSNISFTVTEEHSSPFFGRLKVSNIQPKGSDPVKVNKYLYIKFKSPAHIGNSDVNGVTHPWVDITPDIANQELPVTPKKYLVKAKLNFHQPYTFNGTETFTFFVNGNLDNDPHQFTQTFTLATDQIV